MLNKIKEIENGLIIFVVGRRGCGKSTDTYNFLINKNKSLVFDVNMEYEGHNIKDYFFYKQNTLEEVGLSEINSFHGIKRILPIANNKKMLLDEVSELSGKIFSNYKNGFCLFEDFNKYNSIRSFNLSDAKEDLKNRNSNFIFHFQSIKSCKERINCADYVLLYDTCDSFHDYRLSSDNSRILRKAEKHLVQSNDKSVLISLNRNELIF